MVGAMKALRLLLGLLSLVLVSCATTVGIDDPTTLPDDAVSTCESQCDALGLELEGVSLNKRDVGCLCEPDD